MTIFNAKAKKVKKMKMKVFVYISLNENLTGSGSCVFFVLLVGVVQKNPCSNVYVCVCVFKISGSVSLNVDIPWKSLACLCSLCDCLSGVIFFFHFWLLLLLLLLLLVMLFVQPSIEQHFYTKNMSTMKSMKTLSLRQPFCI